MEAIVILSNLMDSDGSLNSESKARADLAIDMLNSRGGIDFILTIGWAYRQDSDRPIAISVRDYLMSKGVNDNIIKSDINSRDTVGDAIFSKINFVDIYAVDRLSVVTSDYHVNRAKQIFQTIMPINVEVHGCKTFNNVISEQSESDSISVFQKTFEQTNFQSDNSLIETLRSNHPFYNGEIYKKISKKPLPLL